MSPAGPNPGGRRAAVGVILALLLRTAAAHAQAPGLPVYGGGHASGIEVAGAVGFPQAGSRIGGGTAWGATGLLGLGRLGLSATVATFQPSQAGDSRVSFGALADLRVIGGPLSPLAIYALAGYGTMDGATGDSSLATIPLGASAALTIPTPMLSITPWLSPRYDVHRTSSHGTSDTDPRFGMAGGVDLSLLIGLSFRVWYDKVDGFDGTTGVGLAYRF